jgi:hypothetical protein
MLNKSEDAIRDLREVLKLSPNKPEALEELASLLPPSPPPTSPLPPQPLASCSTSPKSSRILSSIPHKEPSAFPFPLYDTDLRKLKIVPLPLTIDAAEYGLSSLPGLACGQRETFSYPNWERYNVKRVD